MSNYIQAEDMETSALVSYDRMMVEACTKLEMVAGLATNVWSDVLKELSRRGLVSLTSGSLDDVMSALVHRSY